MNTLHRVEGVDHHLRIGRAGDLDAAVGQRLRQRGHGPVSLADGGGVAAEVRQAALVEERLALAARRQSGLALLFHRTVQRYQERERTGREQRGLTGDLLGQGDARGRTLGDRAGGGCNG
jgi:hypothetical protein